MQFSFSRYICTGKILNMNVYIESFKTFFKISTSTLGGGYDIAPLAKKEFVEKKGWMNKQEFSDVVTLSQAIPGVFAINLSLYIGHRIKGVAGSLCCVMGTTIPLFLIILSIAMILVHLQDSPTIQSIFKGIRPAVVAMISIACFRLIKETAVNFTNIWIPIFSALLIWLMGISPIYIILAVCIGGLLYGKYVKPHEE